jgi:proline dehydrogenase
MGVMRRALLAASESRWLRQQAPRLGFVKSAVRRFMPGERVEDALAAAVELRHHGISAILTKLGENVTDVAEADELAAHYLAVLPQLGASGLDCQISVKLTQLGLDIDRERCYGHMRLLAGRAREQGNMLWIDMEQHTYVDTTLDVYRRLLAEFPNVGVCLQAYLYRTAADLASLIPLGGGVRLVKGAYLEPASVAYPKKSDVDDSFLRLAQQMIGPAARTSGFRAVFGTHDSRIIKAIQDRATSIGVPRDGFEFALLYGIQRSEQQRLAQECARVRVLITYGDYWFPWYMRRLAERPANVIFVAKSMFSN